MRLSKFKFILPAVAALLLGSCSSHKEITYFQELQPGMETAITQSTPVKFRPNDKLLIMVSTGDPRLNALFNLPVSRISIGSDIKNTSAISQAGGEQSMPYTVDKKGDIQFPQLGTLHVEGLDRQQVAELIRREIVSRDLAKNPIVTVDFLNLSVTVMGEVAHPARVGIDREDFTILDALAAAGDLTIFGRRDNIRVLRDENGVQKVYAVNLNTGADLAKSPVYYLRQNDVIYVEPNATKARTSTANGNSWLTPTFWISIASFLASISMLIFK